MNNSLEILKGKNILIVEDEDFIADKIKKLLEGYTETTILLANCIESALKKIQGHSIFDIILVDVMIPETKSNVEKVKEYEKRLDGLRKDFEHLNSLDKTTEVQNSLYKKRIERSEVLKGIESLIDEEGGIHLIERIKAENKDKIPKSCIFLSAIGNETKIKSGLNVAGENSKWLIKPIPNAIILETCCNVLNDSEE